MNPHSVTDALAIERTRLANERTLLAYVRTFIIFLSSGLAVLQLHYFEPIRYLGIGLLVIAPLTLITGILIYAYMRRRIQAVQQDERT